MAQSTKGTDARCEERTGAEQHQNRETEGEAGLTTREEGDGKVLTDACWDR